MRKIREIGDTNRTVARRARHGTFWCGHCDACLVQDGQRCPSCQHKAPQYYNKKPEGVGF